MSISTGTVLSVSIGLATAVPYTDNEGGMTGIGKRPVTGPVQVSVPGPKGTAGGGVEGDAICDLRFHGGPDRAVYAYAREELDDWERVLDRPLADGLFGENLTTLGLDVEGALVGERWRVGGALLEVTGCRIPCRTFAGAVGETSWVRRFTQKGASGALLRVIEPGAVEAGDPVTVEHRPGHDISVSLLFRAATLERGLLPRTLAAAEWMESDLLEVARAYTAKYGNAPGH
ncbi:MOSC domain-containing protein [Streptomyces sp. NPDC090022]|uniref:MOSC domain-containing protein n=1 Tax=Streptomyces sp. NPDC090022 TaxID=3365920 RepID=UPI0037FEEA19